MAAVLRACCGPAGSHKLLMWSVSPSVGHKPTAAGVNGVWSLPFPLPLGQDMEGRPLGLCHLHRVGTCFPQEG